MHKILLCLSVFVLLLWSSAAYSQDDSRFQLPFGWLEEVIDPVIFGGLSARYNPGVVKIGKYDFRQDTIFSPPGLDIKDVRWKLLAGTPTVMLLYGNGTGQLVEILPDHSKRVQFFTVNKGSTELFTKLTGDDLYAISSASVYISRDTAKTWQPNNDGLAGVTERHDLALDSSQNVWLGTNLGLHKQPLISNTWTSVPAAGEDGVLAVYVDRLDRIWIKSYSWLKVSSDGGATFVDAPTGIKPGTFISFGEDLAGSIYAVSGIAAALEGGDAVYKSAGGTAPFVRIDQSIAPLFAKASKAPYLSISGRDTLWLGTVAGGFRSTDKGVSWTHEPQLEALSINSLIPQGNGAVVATQTAVFKRTQANAWQKIFPATGFQAGLKVLADATGARQYLVGENLNPNSSTAPFYEIWTSGDNGGTWTLDTAGGRDVAMIELMCDASGQLHAAGIVKVGNEYFIRAWKKAAGQKWEENMGGLPPDLDNRFSVQTLGSVDNTNYLALRRFDEQRSVIYSQSVGSGTWENYSNNINPIVLGIAGHGALRVAATTGGVAVMNAGLNYLPLPSNVKLQDLNYTIAAVSPSGRIWAYYEVFDQTPARSKGIYYTDDQVTWQKPADNLDSLFISQLIASGDSLFVVTQVNGVYVMKPGASGNVAVSLVKHELQISPNPAKGTVRLSTGSIAGTDCALTISDATGRVVERRTIDLSSVNGIDVDIRVLPAGSYIVEVVTSNGVCTGKLMRESSGE